MKLYLLILDLIYLLFTHIGDIGSVAWDSIYNLSTLAFTQIRDLTSVAIAKIRSIPGRFVAHLNPAGTIQTFKTKVQAAKQRLLGVNIGFSQRLTNWLIFLIYAAWKVYDVINNITLSVLWLLTLPLVYLLGVFAPQIGNATGDTWLYLKFTAQTWWVIVAEFASIVWGGVSEQ